MTTAGTCYYPPCAGTGNLLLANPPFIFYSMDTNQPTPTKDLPGLSENEFLGLSVASGGSANRFDACNYAHALRIARAAYRLGADAELDACCQWQDTFNYQNAGNLLRAARRRAPSLREQALAILDDCNLDAAHENTLRRALEALPE